MRSLITIEANQSRLQLEECKVIQDNCPSESYLQYILNLVVFIYKQPFPYELLSRLDSCGLTEACWEAFLAALKTNQSLRELDLQNNDDLKRYLEADKRSRIRKLKQHNFRIQISLQAYNMGTVGLLFSNKVNQWLSNLLKWQFDYLYLI